jgi:cytochrome bd-type quinol oxidase subunit 2
LTVMAQATGLLLGIVVGVFVVFTGIMWLASFVTERGLRRSRRTALVARGILMAVVVLMPGIGGYIAMARNGAPGDIVLCMTIMGLAAGGSMAAAASATSDRVLRKHDEAQ